MGELTELRKAYQSCRDEYRNYCADLSQSEFLVCDTCGNAYETGFFEEETNDGIVVIETLSWCCNSTMSQSCRVPDCENPGDDTFRFCNDHCADIHWHELKEIINGYLSDGDIQRAREKIFSCIAVIEMRII